MEIQLPFGMRLYVRQTDMIHKVLSAEEYEQAMDHLEQVRKFQLALDCEDWGIQLKEDVCVACLFDKPELYKPKSTTNNNNNSSSSSSTKTGRWRSHRSRSSQADPKNKKTMQRCDVCGNPVCAQHKISPPGTSISFSMCVDCSHDLTSADQQLNAHHPQLLLNLDRLAHFFTRMSLQLCFCVPNLDQLSYRLTHNQRRHSQISLGNSALGFVGAALGVAGAVSMLTPAGPILLLAAVATSATSGTFQATHAGYNKFLSNQQANQLADRVVGWNGLCLGILNALEQLRQDLIREIELSLKRNDNDDEDSSYSQHQRRNGGRRHPNNPYDLDIWNALAVGSFATTRNAMTGVGVTSAFGASYSQAINTSLQGIPVVGAAFSVGCMAMDAASIQSSLKQLTTPSAKALALKQVEHTFPLLIPNNSSIQLEATIIKQAVIDLNARLEQQRREQERELIEQELKGMAEEELR
jgi:hypothetical protein